MHTTLYLALARVCVAMLRAATASETLAGAGKGHKHVAEGESTYVSTFVVKQPSRSIETIFSSKLHKTPFNARQGKDSENKHTSKLHTAGSHAARACKGETEHGGDSGGACVCGSPS